MVSDICQASSFPLLHLIDISLNTKFLLSSVTTKRWTAKCTSFNKGKHSRNNNMSVNILHVRVMYMYMYAYIFV